MSEYDVHLRVGTHAWDVSSTDDPAHGPLAGLRYGWTARQDDGWPTQHDPTLLVFSVVVEEGIDFDDVDEGTWVHFTFTPDGYATPLAEFGGTVRDLVARPHDRGMVYDITAVDPLQALREDYSVSITAVNGEAYSVVWPRMLQDAGGAGMGIGITPALTDPFTGDTVPTGLGFLGGDILLEGVPGWDALVGFLSGFTYKSGDTPLLQRGILTYRLDGAGDLDAAQPYEGTWAEQGNGNSPLSLVLGPDGWTDDGGNVDGCLLRTDATVWQRQRIEPNRVVYASDDLGDFTWERPHTGPDVTRDMSGDWWEGNYTEPNWVLAGVEDPNQWGTEFALLGADDPTVPAGWFTLPAAQRVAVACYDIEPRHTPDGSGRMIGMLAAAALVIPPGGRWEVRFRLRRTLPDYGAVSGLGGGWDLPDAIAYDDVDLAIAYDDLDPLLTYADTALIGD